MSITLYDTPVSVPGRSLSPHVFKIRLALAHKGLSFRTEWLELSDIGPKMKELGVDPTSAWDDGRPMYTVPVIFDQTTGRFVSDSMNIAFYLDDTYPDRPSLFPFDVRAPIVAFDSYFAPTTVYSGGTLFGHHVLQKIPSSVIEYIRRTRGDEFVEKAQNLSMEDQGPLLMAVRDGFSKVAKILSTNGDNSVFFYGETPSFADFIVLGFLHYMEVVLGTDSKEWKDVERWNEGRWAKLCEFAANMCMTEEE